MEKTTTTLQNKFIFVPKEELGEFIRAIINEEIESQIGPLKSVIAVKQKDACKAMGITDDTARNRNASGNIKALQRDGSRLVYYELKEVEGLKPRAKRKRF